MTVTIDKFGRVLIPKPLRDRLGFAPGTPLELDIRRTEDGGAALEIRPEATPPTFVREHGRLVYDGKIGNAEVSGILRKERGERARRHAGLEEHER